MKFRNGVFCDNWFEKRFYCFGDDGEEDQGMSSAANQIASEGYANISSNGIEVEIFSGELEFDEMDSPVENYMGLDDQGNFVTAASQAEALSTNVSNVTVGKNPGSRENRNEDSRSDLMTSSLSNNITNLLIGGPVSSLNLADSNNSIVSFETDIDYGLTVGTSGVNATTSATGVGVNALSSVGGATETGGSNTTISDSVGNAITNSAGQSVTGGQPYIRDDDAPRQQTVIANSSADLASTPEFGKAIKQNTPSSKVVRKRKGKSALKRISMKKQTGVNAASASSGINVNR